MRPRLASDREYRNFALPIDTALEHHASKLSAWEASFLRSIASQMRSRAPSPKQKAAVFTILKRLGLAD